MTIVYVDVLFLLNGAIDYVLLLASARIAGEPLRRKRFCLAALLGGAYAVLVMTPWFGGINRPVSLLVTAVLMLLIAYGGSGHLWKQSVLFLALACALGGGMLAICLIGKQEMALEQGVVYSSLDVKILLLSSAICYTASTGLFSKLGKHSTFTGGLTTAKIGIKDREVLLTVLIDTGNTLTDPVSGRNVMVAEGMRLNPLLPPGIFLSQEELMNPVLALERLGKEGYAKQVRLLPYRSVGVDKGLLLALKVDRMEIGGCDLGPSLIALSPNPVSDGGGYHALVGPLSGKRGVAG